MDHTEPPSAGQERRRRQVWSRIEAAPADPGIEGLAASLQRVCRAAADAVAMGGAAIHVLTREGEDGVVAASDAASRGVAELQFATSEGPCFVAFETQRPVLIPALDLERRRWPGFVELALERGVGGVFSFPVQEGAVCFGVLDLYADRPGRLSAEGQATALAFARAATELFLDGGTMTKVGELDAGLAASLGDRARIHQAQGMVMVDLGVPLAEALTRMRARAFALDVTLLELAIEVLAGRLTAEAWAGGASSDGPWPS